MWSARDLLRVARFLEETRGYVVIGFWRNEGHEDDALCVVGAVVSRLWNTETYRPWLLTKVTNEQDWQQQQDLISVEVGRTPQPESRRGGIFMRAIQATVVYPHSANGQNSTASTSPEKSGDEG